MSRFEFIALTRFDNNYSKRKMGSFHPSNKIFFAFIAMLWNLLHMGNGYSCVFDGIR